MTSPAFKITGFMYSDKHPQGDTEHLEVDISYPYVHGDHTHYSAADIYGKPATALAEVLRAGGIPEKEYNFQPTDQYQKGYRDGSLRSWKNSQQSKVALDASKDTTNALPTDRKGMSPAEFKAIRTQLIMTQAAMAEVLGVSRKFINDLENRNEPLDRRTELAALYLAHNQENTRLRQLEPRKGVIENLLTLQDVHDKRVSELIKYNSEQVVLRRSFKAQLDIAVSALENLREINEYTKVDSVVAEIQDALDAIENFDPSTMGRP